MRPIERLAAWARHAEHHWHPIPGRPDLGCYGTGYNAWGVQTNQKYLAAMATLAMRGECVAGLDRERALARALAALRFSLASHVSGNATCTDGTQWGHTWISALGIERMMHGVYLLWPHLTEQDRTDLRRVLVSECKWIMADFHRGQVAGIVADVWNSSGKNAPESNLWNGAILWRTAAMFPDHPNAADWQERAHAFLINSVSVAADATDETVLAGKPIRERHVGANFFPHYALDHHGYLNIGYMVICVSNAAMLHFDCKLAQMPRPETLDHHQADLWAVLRRMIFADGRLARIGGDSRVRYAYCQEYLLPSLLYAADRLGDAHALKLAEAQLALIEQEAVFSGDGSFYGRRLAPMAARSPYYYTRLESDRASVLSQWLVYRPLVTLPLSACPEQSKENRVRLLREEDWGTCDGAWHEPEHGAILHRSPTRFASFAWRAFGLGQGLCLPPADGHLAEWESNLVGQIEFAADPHPAHPQPPPGRRLLGYHSTTFDGGFVTCGALIEGAQVELAEGWTGHDLATHHLVFAALPDGHTVIGLELIRVGRSRVLVHSIKGLHLNIPNDLYNGFARTLATASGPLTLTSPAPGDELIALSSRWACVDGRLGVIGIYGATTLALSRAATRRGGAYHSLYVDELCWPGHIGSQWADPGATLLDVGWAVLSGADERMTRTFAEESRTRPLTLAWPDVRGVTIVAADDQTYQLIANFGPETVCIPVTAPDDATACTDLGAATRIGPAGLELHAGQARLLRVQPADCPQNHRLGLTAETETDPTRDL